MIEPWPATHGAVSARVRRRLGALPEDLPYERLPVLFTFRPGGIRDAIIQVEEPSQR